MSKAKTRNHEVPRSASAGSSLPVLAKGSPLKSSEDLSVKTAKHERIADYLRQQVVRLEPRHMLESEAELCARFEVSRGPVRQALLVLESEGRIYRISGRGSFVADRRPSPKPHTSPRQESGNAASTPLWVMPIGEYASSSFLMDGLLSGIDQKTSQYGVALTVGSLATSGGIRSLAQKGNIAGLFTCALEGSVLQDDAFASVPKIWLMTRRKIPLAAGQMYDTVSPDNDAIGALAAQYLLDQGHRHLAFLNLLVEDPSATNRLPGFLVTAHTAGATISVVDDARLPGHRPAFSSDDPAFAHLLVEQLLIQRPRPTGLFIPSDRMTRLIQPILIDQGVRPGQDITIISCNNYEHDLCLLHPRPATIDMNCEEIGRQAADLMALRMNREIALAPVTVLVAPKLVLP